MTSYHCPCGWSRIILTDETIEDAQRIHEGLPIHRIALRDLNDRKFHQAIAAMLDQEAALTLLDEKYHDHLPPDTNCRACDVEHPAIHPELIRD